MKGVRAAVLAGILGVVGLSGALAEPFTDLPADHRVRPVPKVAQPRLHESYADPVFGVTVRRITDPAQLPGLSRVRHYYSKANPFNADETRAIFHGSDGSSWLYDTRTWTPIKSLRLRSSDPEIQWHPTDPNLFYHMEFVGNSPNVRAFQLYDVRTDASRVLRDFSEYDTARGRLEGNMDRSGRYYALIGKRGDKHEAFVYDVLKDRTSRKHAISEDQADDWISVTPSGKYVVMMGGDRTRVYDIDMNHLRDLPKGSFGHADLCLRTDGSDVMVFDGADLALDGNRNINMADLATGRISILARIGWGTTPHVSCRNIELPGWALVSTQGPDSRYPNHDFEIFWVKLDGSREVRRVAHHRSSRKAGGYFAEQHAVTNRTGTKIVFASNWGGEGPISDYLIELPSGDRGAAKPGR